jgi:hypothetical protein
MNFGNTSQILPEKDVCKNCTLLTPKLPFRSSPNKNALQFFTPKLQSVFFVFSFKKRINDYKRKKPLKEKKFLA